MAQHHLLSSKSKTLSIIDIARLSEEEAFHRLKVNRWGNPHNIKDVCCPHCGIRHHAYFVKSRKRWQCKHCKRYFYITTNTALVFHKLSFVQILVAIQLFVSQAKGMSAISMSQILCINHKTAHALCQKLREVLFKTRDLSPLQGEIHEDGAWINFTLRKPNFRKNHYKQKQKADKQGRRFPKFRPTKRCIINFSQRASNDSHLNGSDRTIVAMDYSESAETILKMNQQFVKQGSDIFCDGLDFHYTRWSVNHQECFSKCSVNNNLAESFNARFRDLHRGVHHKCDNRYALLYANQAVYMSDNRHKSNGELFEDVLRRCLWVLPLKECVGYWQGNHRTEELIGMAAFSPKEISQSYFRNLNERMKYEQEQLVA
ncbi:IS1595 family transposase [Pasteurellaceae bacterium 22721_9_1]